MWRESLGRGYHQCLSMGERVGRQGIKSQSGYNIQWEKVTVEYACTWENTVAYWLKCKYQKIRTEMQLDQSNWEESNSMLILQTDQKTGETTIGSKTSTRRHDHIQLERGFTKTQHKNK